LLSRCLQPERQEGFLDLAVERALVGQEEVLGELLRQRGAALHDAGGARIDRDRAQRAEDVDAEMVVEAPVLGRQHRLDQVVRHLLQLQRIVMARAAMADLGAVAVEEGHGEDLVPQRLLAPSWKEGIASASIRKGPTIPMFRPSLANSTAMRLPPLTLKRSAKLRMRS
jgi:hypothetical protein